MRARVATAAAALVLFFTTPLWAQVAPLGATNLGPADAAMAGDVAYDDKHDVFLQVWALNDAVIGRFVGFDGVPKGDSFAVAPTGRSPTVAYSRGAPDDIFLVTYAHTSGRVGQRVRFTGSGATGGTLVGNAWVVQGTGALPTGTGRIPVVFNPLTRRFLTGWSFFGGGNFLRQFGTDGAASGGPVESGLGGWALTVNFALDWLRNRYRMAIDRFYSSTSLSITAIEFRHLDGSTAAPLDAVTSTYLGYITSVLTYVPEADDFFDVWTQFIYSGDRFNKVFEHSRILGRTGQATVTLMDTDGDNSRASLDYSAECRCYLLVSAAASVRKGVIDQLQGRLLDGLGQATTPVVTLTANLAGGIHPTVRATRNGQFVVSYATDAGAILERFAAPLAPAPGPRFSHVTTNIDGPGGGATRGGAFPLFGWALDFGTPGVAGTGIDAVHVWAFPAGGGSPVFVGEDRTFHTRSDVAAANGAQFMQSGFGVSVSGLSDGTYTLVAYPHSTVTGAFTFGSAVTVTIASGGQPAMSLDGPVDNAAIGQPFLAGGWAVDRAASFGSGVDDVHVWAFPIVNGVVDAANGQFVAQGTAGGSRPDVGAVFGDQFTNSGYTFTIGGLAPGQYILGVYARSTVTNTFNQAKFVKITVQ